MLTHFIFTWSFWSCLASQLLTLVKKSSLYRLLQPYNPKLRKISFEISKNCQIIYTVIKILFVWSKDSRSWRKSSSIPILVFRLIMVHPAENGGFFCAPPEARLSVRSGRLSTPRESFGLPPWYGGARESCTIVIMKIRHKPPETLRFIWH